MIKYLTTFLTLVFVFTLNAYAAPTTTQPRQLSYTETMFDLDRSGMREHVIPFADLPVNGQHQKMINKYQQLVFGPAKNNLTKVVYRGVLQESQSGNEVLYYETKYGQSCFMHTVSIVNKRGDYRWESSRC